MFSEWSVHSSTENRQKRENQLQIIIELLSIVTLVGSSDEKVDSWYAVLKISFAGS